MKVVTGHTDEKGKLELDQDVQLPPSSTVRMLIGAVNEYEMWDAILEKLSKSNPNAELTAALIELDEQLWDEQFANSQDALEILAREAREEYYAGRTEDFDPDIL